MESQPIRPSPSPSPTESSAVNTQRQPGTVHLVLTQEEALAVQSLLTITAAAQHGGDETLQDRGLYHRVLKKVKEEIHHLQDSVSLVSNLSIFS